MVSLRASTIGVLALSACVGQHHALSNAVERDIITYGDHHPADANADFGLLIDAGSTGSRLHVYEWPRRVFSTIPPPISHPVTSERWTKRRSPGISSLVDDPQKAAESLMPLINHATKILKHYKSRWKTFPIWVKATAGMRTIPHAPRRRIIEAIRSLLRSDRNPFFFVEADAARVISGEEEAGYAWTGINFALGHLLEDGTGSGTARPTRAVGIVEMGGASSQMSFIHPGHDIIENLFKVQVGGLKHWNIYARSFLHYGAYAARQRIWDELASKEGCFEGERNDSSAPCIIYDACLPHNTPEFPIPPTVVNEVGVSPPMRHLARVPAIVRPKPFVEGQNRFDECFQQVAGDGLSLGLQGSLDNVAGYVEGVTRRRFNEWCDWAFSGQCAFADVYLPLLPEVSSPFGDFHLLGSSLVDTFHRLGVPQLATLRNLSDAAHDICAQDIEAVAASVAALESSDTLRRRRRLTGALEGNSDIEDEDVQELCFKAALSLAMLHNGLGIHMDRELHATDVIHTSFGHKLKAGWTLGAILFEINSLPWVYAPHEGKSHHHGGSLPLPEGTVLPASEAALLALGIKTSVVHDITTQYALGVIIAAVVFGASLVAATLVHLAFSWNRRWVEADSAAEPMLSDPANIVTAAGGGSST